MRFTNQVPVLNLQLFAEGGAAAAGGEGGQGTGVTAPAAGVQSKGVKNPLADVKYGKQPEDKAPSPEVQQQTEPEAKPVDRNAEFEAMIKGDYKEAYDKRVQDTIQKRLKSTKETVDKYNSMAPMMELLGKKYGVDHTDVEALIKAVENDNSIFEEEAAKHGRSVDDEKAMYKLQTENTQLKAQHNEQIQREQAEQRYAVWEQQAQEAKKLYPNLDLNVESQNPQFRQLLFAGIDVGTAYMVLHRDDILAGAMQHTAKTVEQKLTNNIMAGGKRPSENGMSSQSAAITKRDPSQFSRADRDEIRRRVARGERIEL